MSWTPLMRRAAGIMATATLAFTAASIGYLWLRTRAMDVTGWEFFKISLVTCLVWFAIGAVMTFFIVMIVQKNEGR